jgi:CxxC motif-containing protein (DUF1111 family)
MVLAAVVVSWICWPGEPLGEPEASPATRLAGQALFVHEWQPYDGRAHGDGLGPVFNARSCVACHFQGGVGGGGDAVHNVTAYEIHPNTRDRNLQQGLVHAFAVADSFSESEDLLRKCYPVIPGGERVIGGCTVRIEDFDPVRVESTNSIALFGDGLIDRIPGRAVRMNHARRAVGQLKRELRGNMASVGPGRPRVLADGRIGKFGWKAQFATLREFVAAACANELGLGNPLMEQARPLGSYYQSDETDLTGEEFLQLVAFVDTLPQPVKVVPEDPADRALAARGESLFSSIGCADCHTPNLGEVQGIYSDLLLHRVARPHSDGYRTEIIVEVPMSSSHPDPDEWRTPPLWGVADSAPYFHDGASGTLLEAILRHDGGAAVVTKAFKQLSPDEQQSIIAFLETLKAPPDAQPATPFLAADAVALSR